MSNTVIRLWSIRSAIDLCRVHTHSRKNDLSMVTIYEKLTTEVFSSFDAAFSRRKFPGAFTRTRFEVIETHITVLTELRFMVSDWTMSTGRIFAGSEPRSLGNSAHQISPLSTAPTSQLVQEHQVEIAKGHHQVLTVSRHTHRPPAAGSAKQVQCGQLPPPALRAARQWSACGFQV